MPQRTPLSNAISAFSLITAMLIEELEKSGVIDRKQFAKRLRETADDAQAAAPEHLKSDPRLDLQIARHVADLLGAEPTSSPWEPIVIEGGLSSLEPGEG
jgi:hypothetical protein